MASDWFSVLEVVKILSRDKASFSAPQLAEAAKIQGTEKSTPEKIASGWLSKFLKWGYVKRAEVMKREGFRDAQGYTATESGLACQPKAGRNQELNDRLQELEDSIDLLLGVINDFSDKRKAREGEAAFQAMMAMVEEISLARKQTV